MRISEILAPYSTDSRVGRTETEMRGRYSTGMKREEKNVRTHVRTGRAGNKLVNAYIVQLYKKVDGKHEELTIEQ